MILFEKLIQTAVIPTRGNRHAAGLDLSAAWDGPMKAITIAPGDRAIIPTGLKCAIPFGHYGRIAPRSGLAAKNGIDVFAGVIDADYRGEIKVILYNSDINHTFFVEPGMRIAQMIVVPCVMQDAEEVSSIPDMTGRGAAGFGSTGV